jgi:hypothetical protein
MSALSTLMANALLLALKMLIGNILIGRMAHAVLTNTLQKFKENNYEDYIHIDVDFGGVTTKGRVLSVANSQRRGRSGHVLYVKPLGLFDASGCDEF